MRALYFTKYGTPDSDAYVLGERPTPSKDVKGNEVYVKVHAASINPIDWKMARGDLKMLTKTAFPSGIGYDIAGVIEAVGPAVTSFKSGDEIYARLKSMAAFQEYVVTTDDLIAIKPKNIDFATAAAVPLAGLTALQAFEDGADFTKKGYKSVFIPAGLGGVGSFGIQIAKVLGATEIATTVSTAKIPQVEALVPGIKIIDYKKADYTKELKDVDFILDTMGDLTNEVKIMKEKSTPPATITSIAATPPGWLLQKHFPKMGFVPKTFLNFTFWKDSRAFKSKGIDYEYVWLNPRGSKLAQLGKWIEEEKIKVVVDTVYEWKDAKVAFEKSLKGSAAGKIVVKVSE